MGYVHHHSALFFTDTCNMHCLLLIQLRIDNLCKVEYELVDAKLARTIHKSTCYAGKLKAHIIVQLHGHIGTAATIAVVVAVANAVVTGGGGTPREGVTNATEATNALMMVMMVMMRRLPQIECGGVLPFSRCRGRS